MNVCQRVRAREQAAEVLAGRDSLLKTLQAQLQETRGQVCISLVPVTRVYVYMWLLKLSPHAQLTEALEIGGNKDEALRAFQLETRGQVRKSLLSIYTFVGV
jgi:hypothetical protein